MEDAYLVRSIGERFHTQIVELAGNQTVIVFSAMLHEIIDRHTARSQLDRAERGEPGHIGPAELGHRRTTDRLDERRSGRPVTGCFFPAIQPEASSASEAARSPASRNRWLPRTTASPPSSAWKPFT